MTVTIKFREYEVLEADGAVILSRLVTDKLKQGWEPHGELIIIPKDHQQKTYIQAMILQ